jgi:putative N6-adenine-specific DNA methylase
VQADATKPLPIPTSPPGLLVTNPPYGDRLKPEVARNEDVLLQLGESFRDLDGWRMVVLAGNAAFESAFHRRPSARRELWNGPIACQLLSYVPAHAES